MTDTTAAPERVIDPEWENFFSTKASRKQESLQKFLGRVSVFSLLRARELRTLVRIVHVRDFARGEVVIPRGVQQSGLYLVRHGSVHIVRESGDVVATLGPDQLLGEFALLDETPRSTSVVAAEKSELVGFFKPDLTDILSTHPAMGCMILLRLGEDMTATLNKDYKRLRDLGWPHLEGPEDALVPTTA